VDVLKRIALLGAVMMIVLAACAPGTNPPDSTEAPGSTQAPDTTQAPETTQAPDTTSGSETTVPVDGEESTTPWWLLILVGLAFLALIIAFVSRGSKKKIVVAPPPVTWKENAREGYADARWLYDAMSEDLAIWRGNAKFDATADVGATAGTSLADAWQQLDGRIGQASDHLYALEAAAPDQKTSEAASATVSSMRAVRKAIDGRAEARMNYRTVDAPGDAESTTLQDAREREVRSSRNLAEARSSYGSALTNLSTVL
jgi:hypothetical protein